MISSELLNDIKQKPLVLVAAITLHVVLFMLLGVNLTNSTVHKPAGAEKKIVQAVVVDTAAVEAEARKLKQAEEQKKQQALAQQKKIEQEQEKAKKQLADEQRRLAELKQKQAAEQKNLEELKQKNLAEKKRIEAEKKKAEEDRKKAEAEKHRQEELEAKRKAEQEKKKQEELAAKRKAEEEKRRKDEAAELQRKLAEEERLEKETQLAAERNAELQTLRAQYVRLIEQKVERSWLRPANATSDMSCEVIVTQTSLGDVIDVSLGKCVNDLAFQRSIERAVRKASPLPPPPSPEVFDREIHFTFRPGN